MLSRLCRTLSRSGDRLYRGVALLADLDGGAGLKFHRCRVCMQYWFPQVPVWIWCVLFCALIFGLNVISTASSPKVNSGFRW